MSRRRLCKVLGRASWEGLEAFWKRPEASVERHGGIFKRLVDFLHDLSSS